MESDISSGDETLTDSTYENFKREKAYKAVPPPTGTIIPPRANVSFTGIDELAIRNKVVNQEKTNTSQSAIDRNKVIIEDWVDSDDEETDVSESQKETVFNTENSEESFENRSPKSQNSVGQESRTKGLGNKGGKLCFVCYSPNHLIKDCNLHERTFKHTQTQKPKGTQGSRETRPVWNNIQRVNHSNFARNSRNLHQRRSFIPSAVLTRDGLISTARPKITQTVPSKSTANVTYQGAARSRVPQAVLSRSTDGSYYPRLDSRRPRISSYSPSSRSSTTRTPHRPQRPKKIVKLIWVKKGSTVGSQAVLPQTVKKSAMINPKQTWKPKRMIVQNKHGTKGKYLDSWLLGSNDRRQGQSCLILRVQGGYVGLGNDLKVEYLRKDQLRQSCLDFVTNIKMSYPSPKFKFVDEDLRTQESLQALADESWVEAMQEELLQFKLQEVWVLCDLPEGKRVIGTKWVFRNKRDERDIEAIRLFLAFCIFHGSLSSVDVMSEFLYWQHHRRSVMSTSLRFLKICSSKQGLQSCQGTLGFASSPRAEGIEEISVVQGLSFLWKLISEVTSGESTMTEVNFRRSPQWKYLVHVLLHCLSPKSTSWEQFGTNIASALVGLATNQKFNFSLMILTGMLGHISNGTPFLMYPRFVQLFLNKQLEGVDRPQDFIPSVSLPSKVFTFMRKHSTKFSCRITPLTPSMLEVVSALAAEEEQSTSPHSRAASSARVAQGTPTQSAAHSQRTASVQGTASFQGTATSQGTAEIQRTADFQDAAVTPDLERKSDGTEEVNIEEKEASNVKSGETEELDLETTQSTARQGFYYYRTLNFEDEARSFKLHSVPIKLWTAEEQHNAAEVLVSISRPRGLSIPGPIQTQPQQPTQGKEGLLFLKKCSSKKPKLRTETIDELRNYLRVVDFEKSVHDKESLEGISMITELQVIDSPDGEYLIIHRANNHFRAFDTLWEILHVLDRQDLYHLYRVVDDYYEHIPPTGLGLMLLGDLNIILGRLG
ncbi:hypothetical protein Tco_0281780 [Tanacetum coccineum]